MWTRIPLAQRQKRSGVRQLALHTIGQQREARADITDHFGMREEHLLDGGRQVAHVQHGRSPRAHDEGRFLHRVVPDRNDQIGAVDRPMDVIAFRERGGAHVEPGPTGNRALAHLCVEERDAHAAHEIRQGVRQPWPAGRRAQHHQRPLSPEDQVGRAFQSRGMGNRDVDRVPRHERNVGRLFVRDVLRQFQMDRAWPFLLRQPEGLAHNGGDCRWTDDLVRHLC